MYTDSLNGPPCSPGTEGLLSLLAPELRLAALSLREWNVHVAKCTALPGAAQREGLGRLEPPKLGPYL